MAECAETAKEGAGPNVEAPQEAGSTTTLLLLQTAQDQRGTYAEIVCGAKSGRLYLDRLSTAATVGSAGKTSRGKPLEKSVFCDGKLVSPSEFEELGGKGKCKNWKKSIKHGGKPLTRYNLGAVIHGTADSREGDLETTLEDALKLADSLMQGGSEGGDSTFQECIQAVAVELLKVLSHKRPDHGCKNPLAELLKTVVEKVHYQELVIPQLQQEIEGKSREIEALSRKVETLEADTASQRMRATDSLTHDLGEKAEADTGEHFDRDGIQALVDKSVQAVESKLSSLQKDMGSLTQMHEDFLDKSRRQCNVIVGNLPEGDNEEQDKAGIVSFVEEKFKVRVK